MPHEPAEEACNATEQEGRSLETPCGEEALEAHRRPSGNEGATQEAGKEVDAPAFLREADYSAIENAVLSWLAGSPDFDIRLLQDRGLSSGERSFLCRSLLALHEKEPLSNIVARGSLQDGADGVVTRTIVLAGSTGTVTGRVSYSHPEPHRFPPIKR